MALVMAMALSLTALPAHGAPQPPLPIHIESDRAQLSQKSGESTYTGHVVLTRGGLTLTGAKLTVTRLGNRDRLRAQLDGKPAHVDKQPDRDGDDVVTGHAGEIVYTNADATVVMRGDAVVVRGGDRVTGQVIRHNLDTGRTRAQGGGAGDDKRVHITITPQKNDARNHNGSGS